MASELQRLVESVGTRLQRSVAIDDPELHLMAYNAHSTAVDAARTGSILQRSVPRALRDYAYECGAGDAVDLFDLPACSEYGVDIARIGMPVRYQNSLLGFLWLLVSEGPLTDDDANAVRRAAETAGLILHREYLLGELTRGRERELTRDLLAVHADVRSRAAEQLIAENLFAEHPVTAAVVMLTRTGGVLSDRDRLALAAGAEFGRARSPQRYALTLERPDHAVLLIAQSDPLSPDINLAFGKSIQERVLAETDAGAECWIGFGAPRSLVDADESYAEAWRATDVARVVRLLGSIVRYSDLGIYGLLAELPVDRLAEALPTGLRSLLDRKKAGDEALVRTLETFLDNAGEVKRTSEYLHIHRTSLYYRLKRVQEITGLDLSSGDDRLILHLGLKIARLVEMR